MKLTFPTNFLGGAATASEQCEGHNGPVKGRTKGDLHFEKRPQDFHDGIGPGFTSNFAATYKSDIKLGKETANINSVRLGFSGARLFPDGKTLNKAAVAFYHDILDELARYNIKAVMSLHHFDLPEGAINRGGGAYEETGKRFLDYAKFIFAEYDQKVHMFVTMNEPIVPIMAGYLQLGNHGPNVYDPQLAFDAGNRMILAHCRVVNAFKAAPRHAKIGVVINVSPTHPRNANDPDDVLAAKTYHTFHNAGMLDPMLLGQFPAGIKEIFAKLGASDFILTPSELAEIAQVKVDFVGTNYYFPTRLKKYEGEVTNSPLAKLGVVGKDPAARMNVHRGGEIFPADIYHTAKLIQEKYRNLPFFISENGMGVENESRFRNETGEIQDDYRIAFVQEHLEGCHKAISEGANLFGYHMGAISDCWSWVNAYKNRYGFFEFDLAAKISRPKKSARWLAKVIKDNGFDNQYRKLDELAN